MDEVTDGASFEGDAPVAAERSVLPDRRELALIALERTRMPMVISDPRQHDNPIVLANAAFLDLTGHTADEVIGRNCRFLQGPKTDPADVQALRDQLGDGTGHVEVELLNYRKDGTTFWNQLAITPVTDDAGELIYHFASQRDVTARRRAERLEVIERLLLKEVDHRAMNALALVQGIVNLTRSETSEGYAAAVQGRVHALARAHRLLAEHHWQEVTLGDVVTAELFPEVAARVALDGGDCAVSADVVQPLGLALHELMSNAVRHGALAKAEGTVRIVCEGTPAGLGLTWTEVGGAAVAASPEKAVGFRILDGMVQRQLRGSVDLQWLPEGLRAILTLPTASNEDQGKS